MVHGIGTHTIGTQECNIKMICYKIIVKNGTQKWYTKNGTQKNSVQN